MLFGGSFPARFACRKLKIHRVLQACVHVRVYFPARSGRKNTKILLLEFDLARHPASLAPTAVLFALPQVSDFRPEITLGELFFAIFRKIS